MKHNDEFEDISSSSKPAQSNDIYSFSSTDDDSAFEEPVVESNNSLRKLDFSNDMFLIGDEPEEMPPKKRNQTYSLNSFSKNKTKKEMKNRLTVFNIAVSIILIISLFITGAMGAIAYYTGGGSYQELSSDLDNLGIDPEIIAKLPKGITNIALFGLDSRSKVTNNKTKPLSGLADSIIILTVNTDENTVKLTSILRDSWVDISGTKRKINEAYSRGGAQLAVKTINSNFGLNVTDYVAVSLHQLWKVIDFMGGINVHITEAERRELNNLSNSEGFGINKLYETGYVHLDGGQAMTYARIRHTDSDNVRALRQQKVLNCLFEKAKAMPKTDYPALLKKIMENVETSLSYSEILAFAPLLSGGNLSLQSKSVPGNEVVAQGGVFEDTRGGWVWKYDLEETKKFMYKWIFDIDI